MIDAVYYHWYHYRSGFDFRRKAIAKKAGALAKKIIKIVVLGYAYMFYMSLVVGWFADTSVF